MHAVNESVNDDVSRLLDHEKLREALQSDPDAVLRWLERRLGVSLSGTRD